MSDLQAVPRPDLQEETTKLLARLVQVNTVNPPGAERAGQELLAALLQEAGFEVRLAGRTAPRPNLVARLRGQAGGRTLCLLSHMDTVLADPAEWTRDPWSGAVADGFLWGRGAIDMKSQTAAEVTAALSLARAGWRPPHGDLLIVVTVDEETGGAEGAIWLCETHPDLVRCDELVNEGAGAPFTYGGERLHGVCTGEKGVFRFTLTTEGTAGHASMPHLGDNALFKLAPLLEAMLERHPQPDVTPTVRELLAALDATGVDDVRAVSPELAAFLEPMTSVTFAPTMAAASEKINVIPSKARLKVDCRTPPGLGREDVLRRAREVLGDDGYRLTFD